MDLLLSTGWGGGSGNGQGWGKRLGVRDYWPHGMVGSYFLHSHCHLAQPSDPRVSKGLVPRAGEFH